MPGKKPTHNSRIVVEFTHEHDFLRNPHVVMVAEAAVVVVVETRRSEIGNVAVHFDALRHLHFVADFLGEI